MRKGVQAKASSTGRYDLEGKGIALGSAATLTHNLGRRSATY